MRIDSLNFGFSLWPFHIRLNLKRMLRHWWQRRTRGWDDSETYSLDHSLAQIIVPRLKRFKEVNIAYPGSLETPEEWDEILDEMIWTFEFIGSEARWDTHDKETWDRAHEGLKLFQKYYFDLWW